VGRHLLGVVLPDGLLQVRDVLAEPLCAFLEALDAVLDLVAGALLLVACVPGRLQVLPKVVALALAVWWRDGRPGLAAVRARLRNPGSGTSEQ
jgi:hypothetical protein